MPDRLFSVHDDADADLQSATAWFADNALPVALDFIDEYEAALLRIREFPESGQPIRAGTRMMRFRRFPYGIIYRVSTDAIRVLAVSHLRRDPYWRDRR